MFNTLLLPSPSLSELKRSGDIAIDYSRQAEIKQTNRNKVYKNDIERDGDRY